MNELIIVRGMPGSGKSTYAKQHYPTYHLFETDQYFYINNVYVWDSNLLPSVWKRIYKDIAITLYSGANVVTTGLFTKIADMEDYFHFCQLYNIPYTVIELMTEFENIHDVSEEKIIRAKRRFQPYTNAKVIA